MTPPRTREGGGAAGTQWTHSAQDGLDGCRLRHDELARRRRARHRPGTGTAPSGRLRGDIVEREPARPGDGEAGPGRRHQPARVELRGVLDAIRRSGPDEDDAFVWTLVGHLFSIGLRATGFTQYLRRAPSTPPPAALRRREGGQLTITGTPADQAEPATLPFRTDRRLPLTGLSPPRCPSERTAGYGRPGRALQPVELRLQVVQAGVHERDLGAEGGDGRGIGQAVARPGRASWPRPRRG